MKSYNETKQTWVEDALQRRAEREELAALRKAWQTHENMMVDVCAALAIAYEESTPEDVLAAVTALRQQVDTLTAALEEIVAHSSMESWQFEVAERALAAVADGGG